MIRLLFKPILLFILILSSSYILAQENKKFNISGNSKIDDQVFIDIIKEESPETTEQLLKVLAKELTNRGFYHFKVANYNIDTLSEIQNKIYNMQIDEGPVTYIRNVIIDSLETTDSVFINESFAFLSGEVFIQTDIEERINEMLLGLENEGFPFAKIIINSLRFDLNSGEDAIVDIHLQLDKENLRKIDKVEIKGNAKTNENVILNTIRLSRGELYSQNKIEEIPIQLNKLRFFENVEVPKYFINSQSEGILQINVKEKNTNTFDGILGYVPSTSTGASGYFTGFINISLRNLFGTGRGASIKWQQENSLTQELELGYFEPWIFNLPLNVNLQFFQRKQDSSYVKRIIGGSIEYLATENISASLIFESESIIPSINNANQLTLNSSSINSGVQLKLDYRDNIIAPRSGTYFVSTYKFRNKSYKDGVNLPVSIPSNNIEYHNYEFDFGFFYPIFQNQIFALNVHAKEIIGDYYDLSDFFQFGGTNTLRGYRENQFLGNRIIWSNLEYRFLLSLSSYVFAFFDTGYFLINENKSIKYFKTIRLFKWLWIGN